MRKQLATAATTAAPWRDLAILLACAALGCWVALRLGRDIPWDYFNYHAYSAHLLSHDRLAHDFHAAGLAGYFNPIGFAPLALTQYWGMDSMSTAMVLVSLHSLNAFFLYLICRDLAAGRPMQARFAIGIGWFLGVTTPMYLTHLGSTGVDPIGSVLVLAAVWLSVFRNQPRHMFLAGLLAGISVAVKLSNVCFALAIALVIALPSTETMRQWCWRVGCGALGMLGGFAVGQGWWSWRVNEATGNPLFPFFNSVFRSPYFTSDSTGALRFVPSSWTELARLPYRLALSERWTYVELSAPTAVPLATCIIVLALGVRLLIKSPHPRPAIFVAGAEQRLCVLALFASALWVATSANGRYGIPLFMLLGPTLAVLVLKLAPLRYAVLSLALLAGLQAYAVGLNGVQRWNSSQWTPQLLSVDLPESLRRRPHLLLVISSPSHSEIVPHLHPDSVVVNVRGTYSIPSSGASNDRLQQLISRYEGRTQVVFMIPTLAGLDSNIAGAVRHSDAIVDRLGVRILHDQCSAIRIGNQQALHNSFNKTLGAPVEMRLMTCAALRAPPNPQLAALRARATGIMDAFERKCPKLFLPRQPQIEGNGQSWVRNYNNRDSISLAIYLDKNMMFYGLSGQTSPTFIGKVSEWQKDVASFTCEAPGKGKRGIDFFNENEKDSIWFDL